MGQETFAGAKKHATSFLWNTEQRFVRSLAPHVPHWLHTRLLTMLTLLWSALVVWFSYRAQENILWLNGVSALLVAQYLTDVLDGAVGRHRNSGFVRWGFYMDHLLDFVFGSLLFIGYAFLVASANFGWLFALFAVFAVIPISTFLSFPAKQALEIGALGFGPTEYRILVILVNTAIVYYGISWFEQALPYLTGLLFAYSFILVYRTQRDMYLMDMREKK